MGKFPRIGGKRKLKKNPKQHLPNHAVENRNKIDSIERSGGTLRKVEMGKDGEFFQERIPSAYRGFYTFKKGRREVEKGGKPSCLPLETTGRIKGKKETYFFIGRVARGSYEGGRQINFSKRFWGGKNWEGDLSIASEGRLFWRGRL